MAEGKLQQELTLSSFAAAGIDTLPKTSEKRPFSLMTLSTNNIVVALAVRATLSNNYF